MCFNFCSSPFRCSHLQNWQIGCKLRFRFVVANSVSAYWVVVWYHSIVILQGMLEILVRDLTNGGLVGQSQNSEARQHMLYAIPMMGPLKLSVLMWIVWSEAASFYASCTWRTRWCANWAPTSMTQRITMTPYDGSQAPSMDGTRSPKFDR